VSIVLGLIAARDGIVASDGRLFAPAMLENGKVVKPATIESEKFDKTFSLDRERLIGAFAGLMRFSGKDVGAHIDEILQSSAIAEGEFSRITRNLAEGLNSRLSNIDEREVIFDCRKLDVLLVGRKSPAKRELEIARLRFWPANGTMALGIDTCSAGNQVRHCLFGDDRAAAAANRLLSNNRAPNRNARFLKVLALRAISTGIKAAGPQPYGSEPACGGVTFTKRVHCK